MFNVECEVAKTHYTLHTTRYTLHAQHIYMENKIYGFEKLEVYNDARQYVKQIY